MGLLLSCQAQKLEKHCYKGQKKREKKSDLGEVMQQRQIFTTSKKTSLSNSETFENSNPFTS